MHFSPGKSGASKSFGYRASTLMALRRGRSPEMRATRKRRSFRLRKNQERRKNEPSGCSVAQTCPPSKKAACHLPAPSSTTEYTHALRFEPDQGSAKQRSTLAGIQRAQPAQSITQQISCPAKSEGFPCPIQD